VSRDVYSYIAHGQIVSVHGANPYVATPADFPSVLTSELVGPKWVDTPSVYGPLFSHLAGVVTRTSDRLDVLVDTFRLLAIAASLATTFAIWGVVRLVWPARAAFAVAALGLNPAILFQSAASGHNDLLVALAIAVGVVVAAPFLQLEDPTLGMRELAGHEGWLAPSRFFGRLLDAVSGETLGAVARLAFAVGVVVAAVVLVRVVARASASGDPPAELTAGWGWSLLTLTLLGPVLLPWYLAWSLPLVWILPFVPRAVLISLSAILALSQWTAEPLRYPDAYSVSVTVGRYVLTPIVIGLLVWLAIDLRRRLRARSPLREEQEEAAQARQGRGGRRDPQVLEA
jgi:hypothetical protein